MVDSLDRLIMTVALGGTNVLGENGGAMKIAGAFARTSVVDTDTFKSRDARAAVAQLRGRNALPRMEDLFVGYIHPDVSFDLRSESNLAAWRPPHEYSSAGNIWAGAIGAYEGTWWIETPRAYFTNDGAGAGPKTNVYRTLVFGRQALCEAVAEEPHTVIGPVIDKLMRFRPVGWYLTFMSRLFKSVCSVGTFTGRSASSGLKAHRASSPRANKLGTILYRWYASVEGCPQPHSEVWL